MLATACSPPTNTHSHTHTCTHTGFRHDLVVLLERATAPAQLNDVAYTIPALFALVTQLSTPSTIAPSSTPPPLTRHAGMAYAQLMPYIALLAARFVC